MRRAQTGIIVLGHPQSSRGNPQAVLAPLTRAAILLVVALKPGSSERSFTKIGGVNCYSGPTAADSHPIHRIPSAAYIEFRPEFTGYTGWESSPPSRYLLFVP